MRRVLSLCFFSVLALASPRGHARPPETVKLSKCAKRKPAVVFLHAKHLRWVKKLSGNCRSCHHKHGSKKHEQIAACSACHLKPLGKLGSCSAPWKKKNPFHYTCVGCHAMAHKMKKFPHRPKKCSVCHRKKR